MLRQYVITGTKTFTYYKTVNAKDITEAHLLAHQPTDDPEDDWTCHWDSDYDEETKDNGLMVVTHIEDEGEV
jgi:hypothetical protein